MCWNFFHIMSKSVLRKLFIIKQEQFIVISENNCSQQDCLLCSVRNVMVNKQITIAAFYFYNLNVKQKIFSCSDSVAIS